MLMNYFLLAALTCSLAAKEFSLGETFPIAEENFLDLIASHAPQFDSREFNEKIIDQWKQPSPLPGIRKANETRTFFFDPSITLEEDAVLPDGILLAKKGTHINPLMKLQLPGGLLFIDGSDPTQIAWAKSQPADFKWILVKGNPIELEEREERAVYFDQFALLTTRFKIEQVPARVMQEGQVLKIEEVAL